MSTEPAATEGAQPKVLPASANDAAVFDAGKKLHRVAAGLIFSLPRGVGIIDLPSVARVPVVVKDRCTKGGHLLVSTA